MQRTLQHIIKGIKATLLFFWWTPLLTLASGVDGDGFKSVVLANPLKVGSIQELLVAVINIVMVLMVPIIVFFIIYAGFKYVMARGNASQVEEASQSLLYAIIGGVLILGAFAIANIIRSIVAAFQTTT